MKLVRQIVLLAAAIVLGYWLWTIFFPSEEKVILKRMAALAETTSFAASANNINRATKALAFIGFFGSDAQITVDVSGLGTHTLTGRDEIREAGNAAFAGLPGLKVAFLDTTVRVGPDKLTAEVACTAKATVGNDKDYGVEELHFRWQKVDGVWLITRAETVKTLK